MGNCNSVTHTQSSKKRGGDGRKKRHRSTRAVEQQQQQQRQEEQQQLKGCDRDSKQDGSDQQSKENSSTPHQSTTYNSLAVNLGSHDDSCLGEQEEESLTTKKNNKKRKEEETFSSSIQPSSDGKEDDDDDDSKQQHHDRISSWIRQHSPPPPTAATEDVSSSVADPSTADLTSSYRSSTYTTENSMSQLTADTYPGSCTLITASSTSKNPSSGLLHHQPFWSDSEETAEKHPSETEILVEKMMERKQEDEGECLPQVNLPERSETPKDLTPTPPFKTSSTPRTISMGAEAALAVLRCPPSPHSEIVEVTDSGHSSTVSSNMASKRHSLNGVADPELRTFKSNSESSSSKKKVSSRTQSLSERCTPLVQDLSLTSNENLRSSTAKCSSDRRSRNSPGSEATSAVLLIAVAGTATTAGVERNPLLYPPSRPSRTLAEGALVGGEFRGEEREITAAELLGAPPPPPPASFFHSQGEQFGGEDVASSTLSEMMFSFTDSIGSDVSRW